MAIIRQKRKKRFSIIDNQVIEDKNLSWGARGLLEYMLSKPDDWKFYMSELITHSNKDGRDKTYGFMDELKKYGYVTRKQKRNSNGKFGNQDLIVTDSPLTGLPYPVKPDTDKPDTVNPTLLNTDSTNTELTNTDVDDDDTAASQAEENPFDVASHAGINVNSGFHLPVFSDYINRLGRPLVNWALHQTDDNADHPNWSYLITVLKDLDSHSVKTVEQAEQLSAQHKQRSKQRRGYGAPQVRETLPEWWGKDYSKPSKSTYQAPDDSQDVMPDD